MCEAGKEAVWLGFLLAEIGFQEKSTPVTLYADNQGLIVLANNSEFHQCIKHIDVQYYWIQGAISMQQLKVTYIPTIEMAANGLTKALPAPAFLKFWRMIGMY